MARSKPFEWFSYEVWDHGHLDGPDIAARNDDLPFGYWILEINDQAEVSGVRHWRARFRFEEFRRLIHGPMLSSDDWRQEQRTPSPAITFADLPFLQFERQADRLVHFNELRHGWMYGREQFDRDEPTAEVDKLRRMQEELTKLAESIEQLNEWWTLQYRVTGQYCAYERRRRWIPWAR